MSEKIKLLTYNIHKGFNPLNTDLILSGIRDFIRRCDPDIVFLQEIQGYHEKKSKKYTDWPSEPHFEFLADSVWEHFAYGKNAIYRAGHHGNAILSRFPFQESENFNVSFLKRASRSLLYGKVENPVSGKHLHLICAHLGLIGMERKWQLRVLRESILKTIPSEDPVLIAGDFNDWSGALNPKMLSLGVGELFSALGKPLPKTWPVFYPLFPLDRIYFRNLMPISAEIPDPGHWKIHSDHLPLTGTFDWNSKTAAL